MGFKTITIKTSVYNKLVKAKKENESFSEFFDRTVSKKPDLWKYYGAWKLKKGEAKKIKKEIMLERERMDKEWKERLKRYESP